MHKDTNAKSCFWEDEPILTEQIHWLKLNSAQGGDALQQKGMDQEGDSPGR